MDYAQEAHRHSIGIFTPNIHGISDPQELLQKHQDVTTKTSQRLNIHTDRA